MRNMWYKRGLAVSIICLLMLMSAPVSATNEIPSKNETVLSEGGLIDNVPIACYGARGMGPGGIFLNMLLTMTGRNNPLTYISIDMDNNNDVPITFTIYTKIYARDGSQLLGFWFGEPWTLNAHWTLGGGLGVFRHELKEKNYLTGFFKMTLDVNILQDGSHKTILFKGFFFNFGAIIFNSHGTIIE